jgi:hypothetical protein
VFVSSEIRAERLLDCSECDRLFRPTWTCKECGCFMAVKTRLPGVSCPLGKWGPVEEKAS